MTSPSVKLLRTQSDDRLVELARAGHERAFEAIVERYRRPLLRHCRRFLSDARAEDALQQALVSAWTALARGDEVRELRPWLYRIVRNTSLNALRAPGYNFEQLVDSLQGAGGPAELAERRAVVQSTLAGLAGLPERQREALLRIAVEGRPQGEVAEELGLTEGAVRQLVHRARTSLRAAATAVTPLPLVTWLAGANERGDVVARLGEMIAGGGAGATLAKASTVAVLAGGVVGGPAVVNHLGHRPAPEARAAVEVSAPNAGARRDAGRPARSDVTGVALTPVASVTARVPAPATRPERSAGGSHRSSGGSGSDSSSRRNEGRDDAVRPSAPTQKRSDDADDSGDDDTTPRSPESGRDRQRSHGGDDDSTVTAPEDDAEPSDSSGSGSGGSDDDAEEPDDDLSAPVSSPAPTATPAAVAEPDDDKLKPEPAEAESSVKPDSSGHGSD
jgi:RNA polymerase sigma factor (sigma-70 family)